LRPGSRVYELPLDQPDGIDLAGLYRLAAELRDQGAAVMTVRKEPSPRPGVVAERDRTPRLDVDRLIDDRRTRIIVCCGSGGVGKTTTAAALGLRRPSAAGRVVLTVDPARRLAQSMGLSSLDNTPRRVDGVDARPAAACTR
jgi:Mrp family chromosome partitioning ATPase